MRGIPSQSQSSGRNPRRHEEWLSLGCVRHGSGCGFQVYLPKKAEPQSASSCPVDHRASISDHTSSPPRDNLRTNPTQSCETRKRAPMSRDRAEQEHASMRHCNINKTARQEMLVWQNSSCNNSCRRDKSKPCQAEHRTRPRRAAAGTHLLRPHPSPLHNLIQARTEESSPYQPPPAFPGFRQPELRPPVPAKRRPLKVQGITHAHTTSTTLLTHLHLENPDP